MTKRDYEVDPQRTAVRLVQWYGERQASLICLDYAFNLYDEGDTGRRYWLDVRAAIERKET